MTLRVETEVDPMRGRHDFVLFDSFGETILRQIMPDTVSVARAPYGG